MIFRNHLIYRNGIFANIIVLSMEVVMMLPYSLYGYYRNKYSEEYHLSSKENRWKNGMAKSI